MEYMLSTGNVNTEHLDLIQTSGFTIVAEKLNYYRYLSHFRCIHRGAFFTELKTTSVRKLLPESWGFLCPVHTPDGSPCGLLNHLSHLCEIIDHPVDTTDIVKWLVNVGMSPLVDFRSGTALPKGDATLLHVLLDGRLVGYGSVDSLKKVAEVVRHWKITKKNNVIFR
jgi:DNA-directed RNA polymerase I subunit RPA2